jgi:long-chain fatty acid transport protein
MTLALSDYYQPEMLTIGGAISTETMTFSLDLEYQRWSGFRLSTPMQENFQGELVDFDDILVPRIGFEFKAKKNLSLLMGYYYQPSFIPDKAVKGNMNFLDNDKHVGSVGLSMKLPRLPLMKGNTELAMGYQLQYLVDRDVTKDSPTSYNPDYSYGGLSHTFMAGLTISR